MRFNRILYPIAISALSFIFIAACDNQKSEEAAKPTVVLEDTITTEALVTHAQALESISLSNTLSRSSASPGYIQAMDYIKSLLGSAGLAISEQRFEYRFFILIPGLLEQDAHSQQG